MLANVYLHDVLDLWFERRFRKGCRGAAELTRFADDFVAVFRDRQDAERFRQEPEERLAAFGLRVVEASELSVQRAEAEAAVGLEGAHPELLGHGQRPPNRHVR